MKNIRKILGEVVTDEYQSICEIIKLVGKCPDLPNYYDGEHLTYLVPFYLGMGVAKEKFEMEYYDYAYHIRKI